MLKRKSKLMAIDFNKMTALTPQMVSKAYNFPAIPPNIREQCVAIIELGGGVNYSFIANYCKQMKVAPPQLYLHSIGGVVEVITDPDGPDGEVSLDICIVAALCPGAKILTVFAPNTNEGFAEAIAYCATSPLKPSSVSVSWGGPERDYEESDIQMLELAIGKCVDNGVNVFVAAGDNGANDGTGSKEIVVDYPGSSPNVICCGGTRLELDRTAQRKSEVVWGEPHSTEGATGGGLSSIFKPHADQAHLNLPARGVPDVAGNADPASGFIVNVDGQLMAIGGTSAVAPLYASLCTLIAGHLGRKPANMRQVMYQHPEIFYDVISGTNRESGETGLHETATTGFDLCSGMGVVDGIRLNEILASV